MKAIIKHTLPRDYDGDLAEQTIVRDDDAAYRKWVDEYNDQRESEMKEVDRNCCSTLGIPIRFDYDNPLMMLHYLSPGHGIHFHLKLVIHSVKILEDDEPRCSLTDKQLFVLIGVAFLIEVVGVIILKQTIGF